MSGLAFIILAVALSCNAQVPRILAPVGWNRVGNLGGNPGQQWNGQPSGNPQNSWYGPQQQMPYWNGQQQQMSPWFAQQQQTYNYPYNGNYYPQSPQNGQPGYPIDNENYYYQSPQNQWPSQNGPWNNNRQFPQNQWPTQNGPWNNNRQFPQNPTHEPQNCYCEAQQCFTQMPEYWSGIQSIESNSVLTKEEIIDQKNTLVQRLPSGVQKCYKDANKKLEKCIKDQRRNLLRSLTSSARTAYNKIKKIHDNKRITRQQEFNDISQILRNLNQQVVNELFTKIPGLRYQMTSGPNQMNQFGQQPYNQNQMQYGQFGMNPYNQNQMQYGQFGMNPYNQNQMQFGQFNPQQGK